MSEFKKIAVKSRQTLGDIAIQEYGGYEGVEPLLEDNREELTEGLTTSLYQGMILKIRVGEPVDERALPKLKAQNIEPATGEKSDPPPIGPDYNDDYNNDYYTTEE